MISLRRRLLFTAAIALAIAFVLMGLALSLAFDRALRAHAVAEISDRINALARASRFGEGGVLQLARQPGDPRFSLIHGGLYWQIARPQEEELRSPSLGDYRVPWAIDPPRVGTLRTGLIKGPENQALLTAERVIMIDAQDGAKPVRFLVGMDDNELLEARLGFYEALVPSMLAVFGCLLAGLWSFLRFGLAPLGHLQGALSDVRTHRKSSIVGTFPKEIAPLVEEANALIAARSHDLVAARARAGDLAHALKTPLAVLDVHIRKLRSIGHPELADPIAEEVDHMDRVIRRELARARANIHATSVQQRADAFPIVERTCVALAKLAGSSALKFRIDFDRSIALLVDDTDLMEMIGNLVENATKWAKRSILVTGARKEDGSVLITVEDDGPGLSAEEILAVQTRGVRLDQSIQGTGLGLGIVRDLCELYGGELILGAAKSGGLSAAVKFPASRVAEKSS